MIPIETDPQWWADGSYDGRPIREILRARDIGALFGFLVGRGLSRGAIAAATGLTESRVRSIRQGKQRITSYDVLERIANGLGIERGLMGLAYTDTPASQVPAPTRPARAMPHPVDGKLMVDVGEGVYLSGPQNQMVWLAAFSIDVGPVTNAEYAVFVTATGSRPPRHWTGGTPPHDRLDHPVVHVTHHDACAYAGWAGKELPSEAQWEKAARGEKGYEFPWGNQPTPAKCNVRETAVGGTTPVLLYRSGASPYGVHDLAGNVWEWCRTATTAGRYVLKGSAFTSAFDLAAGWQTNDAAAEMSDDDTGFRCVTMTRSA
jgi:formylglycine-generating enzyme required for sulfatase activity